MRAQAKPHILHPAVILWMAAGLAGFCILPWYMLDDGFFSWRARQDEGRQAAVVWLAPDDHDYPWHP